MLTDEIAELRRLLDAATPGPWQAWTHPHSPPELRGPIGEPPVAHWLGFDDCDRPKGGHMLNVALIAALRNAAPALLSAHDDAVRLREALQGLVDYFDDPASADSYDEASRLDAARAALRPAEQGGG